MTELDDLKREKLRVLRQLDAEEDRRERLRLLRKKDEINHKIALRSRTRTDKVKEVGRGLVQGVADTAKLMEYSPFGAAPRAIGAMIRGEGLQGAQQAVFRGGPASAGVEKGLQGLENAGVVNPRRVGSGFELGGEVLGGGGVAGGLRKLAGAGLKTLATREAVPTLGAALAGGTAQEQGAGTGGTLAATLAGGVGPGLVSPSTLAGGLRRMVAGAPDKRQQAQQVIKSFDKQGLPLNLGAVNQGGSGGTAQAMVLGLPGTIGKTAQSSENLASAAEQFITKFSSGGGVSTDTIGAALRRGFHGFFKDSQKHFNKLYKDVDSVIADDAPVTVNNLKRELDDLTKAANADKGVAAAWLNTDLLNKAKALPDDGIVPYITLREMRREVGATLGDRNLMLKVDTGRLKRLYSSLSDDVEDAVRTHGDANLLGKIKTVNRDYRLFAKRHEQMVRRFLGAKGNKTETEVYNAVFSASGKPDPVKIRLALNSLPRQGREEAVNGFLYQMGLPPPSAAGQLASTNQFSIDRFVTMWVRAFGKEADSPALNAMFSTTPKLRGMKSELRQFAKNLDAIKTQSGILANPSGTAARGLAMMMIYTALGGLTVLNPSVAIGAVGSMAGARGIAELMLSPKFIRWVNQTGQLPLSSMGGNLARLNVVMQNEDLDEEVAAFQQNIMALVEKAGQQQ